MKANRMTGSWYLGLLVLLLLSSCASEQPMPSPANVVPPSTDSLQKIPILNFGTFHMGFTSDANSTEFDENDKENQRAVARVAKALVAFQPTVILVETVPSHNEALRSQYQRYCANPKAPLRNPSEVELLGFELGRLAGVKKIYGIDHKMGYNYRIGEEISNLVDSVWHDTFYANPMQFFPEINVNMDSLALKEKLQLINRDRFLDFLIAINADMLTHAGSEKGFEGADEAAKYYQRNLRMYANLNRIPLEPTDRVFILMGASHTAFFRDFISRSPKYEMVNTFDYLK
ncbi:MAG: DUF5694 domain-containing protein [Bacteroidota bacterium]